MNIEVGRMPGGSPTVTATVTFTEQNTGGDYGGDTTIPSRIQRRPAIKVKFDWTQTGFLFGSWAADKWEVQVLFENMGTVADVNPAPASASGDELYVAANPHTYSKTLTIRGGDIPAGIYRVISRLALKDRGGLFPIVAFEDHGLVQFYHA